MAILLVTVAFANIALPLTNAFAGEFLMFNGLLSAGDSSGTKYYVWFTVFAGISIILAAVYTLNMIRKVFYGNTNSLTAGAHDIRLNEKIILGVIVAAIFVLGIYPKPFFEMTDSIVDAIIGKSDMVPFLNRH